MPFDTVRWVVSRHPGRVVAAWGVAALLIGVLAPDLTRLAAEGQAHLVPRDAESHVAEEMLHAAWPDQAYEALAVVALKRDGGLQSQDTAYARVLVNRFESPDRPAEILRVLGPDSPAEV